MQKIKFNQLSDFEITGFIFSKSINVILQELIYIYCFCYGGNRNLFLQ